MCQSELTEFFAELTEFAIKLSEFSSPKQYSRNSIPPVSYIGDENVTSSICERPKQGDFCLGIRETFCYAFEGMPRSRPSAGVNRITTAKPSPRGRAIPN